MYCKDCIFNENHCCQSEKIGENIVSELWDSDLKNGDCLSYSYDEGGSFLVCDNFGCVHFEKS